jgi:hypothetical protein
MKASTVLSFSIFLLVLLFSTTLFAAEATSVKQVGRKIPAAAAPNQPGKLPPMIKINPADVDLATKMIDSSMQKAKEAGEKISIKSADITKQLKSLEIQLSHRKNKVQECKNKNYTKEDQKNAKCTDDMTIAQCSKALFKQCMTQGQTYDTFGYLQNLTVDADKIESYAKELHENASYLQSNSYK